MGGRDGTPKFTLHQFLSVALHCIEGGSLPSCACSSSKSSSSLSLGAFACCWVSLVTEANICSKTDEHLYLLVLGEEAVDDEARNESISISPNDWRMFCVLVVGHATAVCN